MRLNEAVSAVRGVTYLTLALRRAVMASFSPGLTGLAGPTDTFAINLFDTMGLVRWAPPQGWVATDFGIQVNERIFE